MDPDGRLPHLLCISQPCVQASHGQFCAHCAAQCSGDTVPFGNLLSALMHAAGHARQAQPLGPAAQQSPMRVALLQAAQQAPPSTPTAQHSPASVAAQQAAQAAAPPDPDTPRGMRQTRVPLAPTIPRDSNPAAGNSAAAPAASKEGTAAAQQAPAQQAGQPASSAASSSGHPPQQWAQPSRGQAPRGSRLRLPTRWMG
mgnify:CR=1 FL=1